MQNPYPRYFLTDRVVSVLPDDTFASQIEKLNSFATPTVLLETEVKDSKSIANKKYVQSIAPTFKNGDKKEFVVDSPHELYFFVGESLLPGVLVTVDGAVVSPIRANYIYFAISLTPGKHMIKLEYKR